MSSQVQIRITWAFLTFSIFLFLDNCAQAVGVILIGVGAWALAEKSGYSDVSSLTFNPAVLLIVAGALTFVVAFCGCVGALRENKLLLKVVSIASAECPAIPILVLLFWPSDCCECNWQFRPRVVAISRVRWRLHLSLPINSEDDYCTGINRQNISRFSSSWRLQYKLLTRKVIQQPNCLYARVQTFAIPVAYSDERWL